MASVKVLNTGPCDSEGCSRNMSENSAADKVMFLFISSEFLSLVKQLYSERRVFRVPIL